MDLEPAIPSGRYYTGYKCRIANKNFIADLCQLCNANLAFTVEYGRISYLDALREEERE